MPRLIDADKVAEAIAWLDEYDFVIWHDVQECIDKVPTVDSESVVRCKDCRYWDNPDYNCWCKFVTTDESDYCSQGVRKDAETNL